ncbi:MAG: fused MFS/spermidine synthase [Planctomycetes bacterium]|nr:fused MFS/spermidine synthase [Planctomycetota bacterium]
MVRGRTLLLLACFFLSGACGLVYEIVWSRLLGHVFGNSVHATATVLAAFMGGLALGSFWGGRMADRRNNPVRLYGLLEIGVGFYCLVLPKLLDLLTPLYAALYRQAEGGASATLVLVRTLACGLLLLVPTTFMGATLPLLLRAFVRRAEGFGRAVALVYALNTFGAVTGTVLTGFFLIPKLGVQATVWTAVGVNVAVGLVAVLFLGRRQVPAEQATEAADSEVTSGGPEQPVVFTPWEARASLIAFGVSGFAAMADEVALARVCSLLLGSSTYAFSLMLTAFILGIGLGSLILAAWIRPTRELIPWVGAAQAWIGVFTLVMVFLIGRLPVWVLAALARYRDAFGWLQWTEFLYLFGLMVIPTSLMGAMFPLTAAIWTRRLESLGRSTAEVYGVNTLGAILGSLSAGFLWLPGLGVQDTLILGAALNFGACSIVLLSFRTWGLAKRVNRAAAVIGLAALCVFLLPRWDMHSMTSAPFLYGVMKLKPESDPRAIVEEVARLHGAIRYSRDGTACTVTVKESSPGVLHLAVNGKVDATSVGDMNTQKLLGHLPALLHPSPREVLVIGLGSGMTLGSILTHGPDRADCVEISPEVAEAVSLFFREFNGDCLNHPAARLLIGDGRNHVFLTDHRYDVITSEPSNPWMAGVGDLFTLEFWQKCRERLSDDGIMCQWLQTYQLDLPTFHLILRTFHQVFPEMGIWYASSADLLLIGSKQPLRVDLAKLGPRLDRPQVKADVELIGVADAATLLAHFLTDGEGAARLAGPGLLHTDDNARLEFDMPRQMYRSYLDPVLQFETTMKPVAAILAEGAAGQEEMKRLAQVRQAVWHLHMSAMWLKVEKVDKALDRVRAAQAAHPGDLEALLALYELLNDHAGRLYEAKQTDRACLALQELLTLLPPILALEESGPERLRRRLQNLGSPSDLFAKAACNLGVLLVARQPERGAAGEAELESAIEAFELALKLDPNSTQAHTNLGVLMVRRGRFEEALPLLEKAVSLATESERPRLRFNLGLVLDNLGRPDEALEQLAVAAQAEIGPACVRMGLIYEKLGRFSDAAESYQSALKVNARDRQAASHLESLRSSGKLGPDSGNRDDGKGQTDRPEKLMP